MKRVIKDLPLSPSALTFHRATRLERDASQRSARLKVSIILDADPRSILFTKYNEIHGRSGFVSDKGDRVGYPRGAVSSRVPWVLFVERATPFQLNSAADVRSNGGSENGV